MAKNKIVTLGYIRRVSGNESMSLKKARELGKGKNYIIAKDLDEAEALTRAQKAGRIE